MDHIYLTQTISVLNKVDVVFLFFSRMLCAVSFLIVLLLSVDRFLAGHLHLRYHEIVTVRRVTLFVCFLWAGSGVVASLEVWQAGYFEVIAAPVACICFLANAVLYFKIYRVVRRHQLQIS